VKVVITPRAWRQVERQRRWWKANREKAPELFADELVEAERHLSTLPESGEPWRIRRKRTIRRWLLEKTAQHLYYSYSRERDEVLVLALWGARRSGGPKL
jgi:plasmid stabilization system protein ParE